LEASKSSFYTRREIIPRLKTKNFYYGAVIETIMSYNEDASPSLVEVGEDKQAYSQYERLCCSLHRGRRNNQADKKARSPMQQGVGLLHSTEEVG